MMQGRNLPRARVAHLRGQSFAQTLSGVLALHRAALTEIRRFPVTTVLGLAIPLATILLITATDLLLGAAGEITRSSMPILLAVLLVTASFGALAVPVAEARERGTVRFLATVPLHRGAILLAHTPIALALALVVAVAGLAAARTPPSAIPGAFAACAGLCAIGLGLGSVGGALARRGSQVRALGMIVPATVLLTAGALPFEAFLPGADWVLGYVPTTALAYVLADTLAGGRPGLGATAWIAAGGLVLWAVGVTRCRR